MKLLAGQLNRVIRFERQQRPAGRGKAGQETWTAVATVAAEVQDVLPSRAERQNDGLPIATRPARVRCRYRQDITGDMRIAVLRRENGVDVVERTMEITSGPVEIGFHDGLEMMAADYSTKGSGA